MKELGIVGVCVVMFLLGRFVGNPDKSIDELKNELAEISESVDVEVSKNSFGYRKITLRFGNVALTEK